MTKAELMLIGYCIFFTLCNINIFIFYYLYGYFFERKLRQFDQRVNIPGGLTFLFHFKGVYGADKISASRSGAIAQFGAIMYFFIMESFCFIMGKLTNDMIWPCRIAFVLFVGFLIGGIIRIIATSKEIRKRVKENELLNVHLFVEENAVDKRDADISESDIFKEDDSQKQKMEMALDRLWEEENDHENETTGAEEGKAALKSVEADAIGNDYEIETEDVLSEKDHQETTSLSDVEMSEEGVYKVERDLKAELAADYDGTDDAKGEAEDFSLGKKYIDSLKKDVIGDDFDPIFDDSEAFQ